MYISKASLLLSPIALLELEMLYGIRRVSLPSRSLEAKLASICDLPFVEAVRASIGEAWTRVPFDRLIVANAKAAGLAQLITADKNVRSNDPRAVW